MKSVLAAAAAMSLVVIPAHAQQKIEWKQVVNMPKGTNVPQGLKLDILGIELGDGYADAKAKLEKLLAEVKPSEAKQAPKKPMTEIEIEMEAMRMRDRLQSQSAAAMGGALGPSRLEESQMQIYLPTPGGRIGAEYVSRLTLTRYLPGTANSRMSDIVVVRLSAPSSGQQVISIRREISYGNQADQPRVSELLQRLKEKLGAEPRPIRYVGMVYRWQYDGGHLVAPPNAPWHSCLVSDQVKESQLAGVNAGGACDVVFDVVVQPGISQDHARSVEFVLGDNERIKANLGADFKFVRDYAHDVQNRSHGAVPKL